MHSPSTSEEDDRLAADKRQPLVAQGKADPEVGEDEHHLTEKKRAAPDDAKADESQVKKARVTTTPPTLKTLLPNKGASIKEVWITRNPKTFGYQIRYPTSIWIYIGIFFPHQNTNMTYLCLFTDVNALQFCRLR